MGLDSNAILMMQGGSAATSAVGAYYGAQGQKAQLEGAVRLGEVNARMADQAARNALASGEKAVSAQRLKTAQLKARQRTAFAANGVDLSTGSPLRVMTDTDLLGELDAQTIEQNAIANAWGYRIDATNLRNEALMRGAQADAISPGTALASSLLSGATSVAASWYKFNKG